MKFSKSFLTRCRGVLFLITACALISSCATTNAISPNQSSAYKAAMAGRLEEARNLLKEGPKNSRRTFMLSCIELSEGNLAQARRHADEFITVEPYIADGKVLRELIEQRKAYPEEAWTVSYAAAWKASGSPSINIENWLTNDRSCEQSVKCEPREIPEAIRGTPEEMLVALDYGLLCDSEKFVELCLSHTSRETPIPIKLLALEWINVELGAESGKLSEALRKRADILRHDLVRELATQLPMYMKFPILAMLDQTNDKKEFSSADIDSIEEAVYRPELSPSREELYDYYLKHYIISRADNPYLSALTMANFSEGDSRHAWGLRRKIVATAEKGAPEVRERLANILDKLGRAQVKHGTLTELLLSTPLFYSAAEIRGNKREQERFRELQAFASNLVQVMDATEPSFFWPIRPLVIDSTRFAIRNEVAFYQLFYNVNSPTVLLNLLKN